MASEKTSPPPLSIPQNLRLYAQNLKIQYPSDPHPKPAPYLESCLNVWSYSRWPPLPRRPTMTTWNSTTAFKIEPLPPPTLNKINKANHFSILRPNTKLESCLPQLYLQPLPGHPMRYRTKTPIASKKTSQW